MMGISENLSILKDNDNVQICVPFPAKVKGLLEPYKDVIEKLQAIKAN
jgi:hypothetical protein